MRNPWIRYLPIVLLACASAQATAQADARRAFVTSAKGNGDLATWAESGGQGGLAGADAVCRSHARAANLPDADAFVAWLSDANDDAYCRVHGLTGRRDAHCGLTELPTDAGPWQRTDGLWIADSLADLLDGRMYRPIDRDESGRALPFNGYLQAVATGTDASGRGAGGFDCAGWTRSSGDLLVGGAEMTTGSWGFGTALGCGANVRLYCFQPGPGRAAPPGEHGRRQAFLTEASGPGDLGSWPEALGTSGLAAGDAICRARAAAAGLYRPDTFKALLSDGRTSAHERFSQPDLPWVRLDGVRLADDAAALRTGAILAPLNVTESGTYAAGIGAWTGTYVDGAAMEHCDDWTDAGALGRAATVNIAGPLWMRSSSPRACATRAALYCLSDADTLFHSGFDERP